ncbi:MAG TPA: primosomal protein N' [bacterium]|nr:primosomal protein N' [bacterium]
MIAEIIPETKSGAIEVFDYIVPDEFKTLIKVGQIVLIPFGRREIRGLITKTKTQNTSNYKLKKISRLLDLIFPLPYLQAIEWIANYYLCSQGEALSLFLPPFLTKARTLPEKQKTYESKKIDFSDDQKEALSRLEEIYLAPQKPTLLFGITGSGKTELYIELAKNATAENKQVVVLVPEITLTPQTVERFEQVFNNDVVVMHSNLSKSERFHCYQNFYSGMKSIIVGPRSALLVPSKNLGLIIVDEEHTDAYKQDASPRYNAVDLACEIGAKTGAMVLLGTATPRIETFHRATTGEYNLVMLESRHHRKTLPSSTLVDLREEVKAGNFSPISNKLKESIEKTLEKKRQVLLFLNRRGMATFVSCRDCGHVELCPNCSIPMVYHLGGEFGHLNCHHCDHKAAVPTCCPDCHSHRIKFFGSGIEKVELELKHLFPNNTILKVEGSALTRRNSQVDLNKTLRSAKADIILGTQIIAKGFDLPGVDLVGVISADIGLNLPHFRAGERTFQLVTQVSGRSGRLDDSGHTLIQTYWPDSPALKAASLHDYSGFYKEEIKNRELFLYPPFRALVRIISEHKQESTARRLIDEVKKRIDELRLHSVGPAPCFHQRMHDKYRFHLLIKTTKLPCNPITQLSKQFPTLIFDADPINML